MSESGRRIYAALEEVIAFELRMRAWTAWPITTQKETMDLVLGHTLEAGLAENHQAVEAFLAWLATDEAFQSLLRYIAREMATDQSYFARYAQNNKDEVAIFSPEFQELLARTFITQQQTRINDALKRYHSQSSDR